MEEVEAVNQILVEVKPDGIDGDKEVIEKENTEAINADDNAVKIELHTPQTPIANVDKPVSFEFKSENSLQTYVHIDEQPNVCLDVDEVSEHFKSNKDPEVLIDTNLSAAPLSNALTECMMDANITILEDTIAETTVDDDLMDELHAGGFANTDEVQATNEHVTHAEPFNRIIESSTAVDLNVDQLQSSSYSVVNIDSEPAEILDSSSDSSDGDDDEGDSSSSDVLDEDDDDEELTVPIEIDDDEDDHRDHPAEERRGRSRTSSDDDSISSADDADGDELDFHKRIGYSSQPAALPQVHPAMQPMKKTQQNKSSTNSSRKGRTIRRRRQLTIREKLTKKSLAL